MPSKLESAAIRASLLAALIWSVPSFADCDCGSSDAAAPCTGNAITVSATGKRAITFSWRFSSGGGPAACGRFANGDYWLAPTEPGAGVTIESVSDTGSGPLSLDADPQAESMGLLSPAKTYGNYVAGENLLPVLPAKISSPSSLVAAAQLDEAVSGKCGTSSIVGNCADAYNVVTVLDRVPERAGADLLRPSINDPSKKLLSLSDFDLSRLPSRSYLTGTTDAGFESIRQRWSHSTEIFGMWTLGGKFFSEGGRAFRASNFVDDYAGGVAASWGNDLMQVFSASTPVSSPAKRAALAAMLVYGKDVYDSVYGPSGRIRNWGSGAGQWLGRYPAAVFFAALATDPRYGSTISSVSKELLGFADGRGPHELDQINVGVNGPIWGDFPDTMSSLEIGAYWAETLKAQCFFGATGTCVTSSGKRTSRDPYGFIDGPPIRAGAGYMYVSSGPQRTLAALMFLMPNACSIVNYEPLVEYIDRLQNTGIKAMPDPCAPPDPREDPLTCDPYRNTGCVYYRSTWGPDPTNPSQCIRGNSGRFPAQDGTKPKFLYTSTQVETQWANIRGSTPSCTRAVISQPSVAPQAPELRVN